MYTRWSPELTDWLNRPGTQALQLGDLDYHVTAGPHQVDLLSIAPNLDDVIDSGLIQKFEKHSVASICNVNNTSFFAKHIRFTEKDFHSRLRYVIAPSRSYWTAVVADRLHRSQIQTPAVLAAAERRSFGLLTDSYIFTEALHDAVPADTALKQYPNCLDLFIKCIRLLKSLHDCGVVHGDIKLTNIFVQSETLGFWDLDSAMIFPRRIPQKWVIRDLGRLLSSFIIATDALRETSDQFFNVNTFIDCLSDTYSIDRTLIAQNLKNYWLKKMKLKRQIQF